MAKIRVLVVEDSITTRNRIAEALGSDPEMEVVGEASDGRTGVEKCLALQPDVVTLDMVLPIASGLAATEAIMAHRPTPILVVSSSTNRGDLFSTYDALAAGALDVLEKPQVDEVDEDWDRRLVAAVRMVSRIRVITHVRGKLRRVEPTERASPVPALRPTPAPESRLPVAPPGPASAEVRAAGDPRVLAVGASTGGPGAVLELLRGLPADFPLPILLVIHIGQTFGAALADWLDDQSPLRVAFARDGEPLPPFGTGCVRLAPPDSHLVLQGGRLALTREPERHSCRPSVDVLFESVAAELGGRAAACLLTGMGKDGAAGLLALRRVGALTIAQDEATSVVFGMPGEAVRLGAARHVLPLGAIAPALAEAAGAGRRTP